LIIKRRGLDIHRQVFVIKYCDVDFHCQVFIIKRPGLVIFRQVLTINREYHYQVRSRTLAALPDLKDQWTGVLMRAKLTVRPRDRNTLQMRLDDAEYTRINRQLDQGWDSHISRAELQYQPMKMSNKPFEVQLKNGAMRSISFPERTSNDEANMIKGIVSQLQVDTQAQNLIKCKHNQMPEKNSYNGVFKTMEPSVTGKCETFYDVSPIPEQDIASNPNWVPLPKLKRDGDQYIEVVKTTNYSNCDANLGYHFGITGMSNQKPGSNKMGE
jgi:Lipoprotein amino terminal region